MSESTIALERRCIELERRVIKLERELAELRAPLERMLQRDLDSASYPQGVLVCEGKP